MSVTQSASGQEASNRRSTRSGAGAVSRSLQAVLAQEPGHALARATGAIVPQLGMDPRHAIGATAPLMDVPDPLGQRGMGERAS